MCAPAGFILSPPSFNSLSRDESQICIFSSDLTLPSGQTLGMAPGPDFPIYPQCHVNLLWSRRLRLHLASMPQSNPEDHHLLNPLDGEPQAYPRLTLLLYLHKTVFMCPLCLPLVPIAHCYNPRPALQLIPYILSSDIVSHPFCVRLLLLHLLLCH